MLIKKFFLIIVAVSVSSLSLKTALDKVDNFLRDDSQSNNLPALTYTSSMGPPLLKKPQDSYKTEYRDLQDEKLNQAITYLKTDPFALKVVIAFVESIAPQDLSYQSESPKITSYQQPIENQVYYQPNDQVASSKDQDDEIVLRVLRNLVYKWKDHKDL